MELEEEQEKTADSLRRNYAKCLGRRKHAHYSNDLFANLYRTLVITFSHLGYKSLVDSALQEGDYGGRFTFDLFLHFVKCAPH
jgi:hypothetical protein